MLKMLSSTRWSFVQMMPTNDHKVPQLLSSDLFARHQGQVGDENSPRYLFPFPGKWKPWALMLRVEKQNAEVASCKFSLPFSPNQVAMIEWGLELNSNCSSTWEKVGQPEEGRRSQCFTRKGNSEKGPLQIGLSSPSDPMFTFFSTQTYYWFIQCFSAIIRQTTTVLYKRVLQCNYLYLFLQ